jgi:hypothetical protein
MDLRAFGIYRVLTACIRSAVECAPEVIYVAKKTAKQKAREKTIQLLVEFEPSIGKKLRAFAEKKKRTMKSVIEIALEQYFQQEETFERQRAVQLSATTTEVV